MDFETWAKQQRKELGWRYYWYRWTDFDFMYHTMRLKIKRLFRKRK